jgi:Mn-dependent DtxR family transcriptional regulator
MKQRLDQLLGAQGAMTSAAIQARLNVSQATVSRLVKAQSDALVICGEGKSTQYALARHAAKDFWREVSTDRYTSAPLKAIALMMAAALD